MDSEVASSAPWIRERTSAATAGLNGIIPPAASGERGAAGLGFGCGWSLWLRAQGRQGRGAALSREAVMTRGSRRNRRKRMTVGEERNRLGRRASYQSNQTMGARNAKGGRRVEDKYALC